ncbi:glucuronate isomerase [Xenorhabdus bovienii]|uniref:glucuronate isomerase n=1 Tax=Xenorhabdus bovienii TaxID=40576 RepID=UPI000AAE501C
MKTFMCEDLLLSNEVARRLYHDYAALMPIYDYHCYLKLKEIVQNHQLYWLEGDRYK